MIKIATIIYWCIDHGIGDLIFWPLLLTFCGFLIWLAEDSPPPKVTHEDEPGQTT